MKNLNTFIYMGLIALLYFLCGSCDQQDDYIFGADHAFISILQPDSKTIKIDHQTTKGYCIIKSNTCWKIISDAPWLNCPVSEGEFGDTLRFSATENNEGPRTAHLIMYTTKGNKAYDTLTVIQAHTPAFKPQGYDIRITSGIAETLSEAFSPELSFTVNTSAAWEAFCRPEDNWITLLTKEANGENNAYFSVKANDQLENRKAYIYVRLQEYHAVCDSFLITQSGRPKHIKITTPRNKNLMMDERASDFSFVVEGDGKWKVTTNSAAWLSFDQNEYSGTATVQVHITQTTSLRKGEIHVSLSDNPNVSDTLRITQNVIPAGRLKDSLALVALYYSTNGPNWEGAWKLEQPIDEWVGIFLDNDRVIDISLGSRNLEGTLPEELGWMTELTKIKFYSNKLSGPIPASFNKLINLTHIFMSKNKLNGQIPDLSALKKLERLDLTFNRLEGTIPVSLTTLPKLPYVMIQYNQLAPSGCIPAKYKIWEMYINPQRAVYGDPSTDYNLPVCE